MKDTKGKNAKAGEKEEEKKSDKKPEKEKDEMGGEEDDTDKNMVKIEELLSDLTLNDSEAVTTEVVRDDALTDFVEKLGSIRIEK